MITECSKLNTPLSLTFPSIREHFDLISFAVNTVANAVFLAGKLFSSIPQAITRSSFVAMKFMGLLYLDWQISFTVKTARDCQFAARVRNLPLVAQTALCALNGLSDALLISAGFVASVTSWAKYSAVTATLYTIMRPWGVTFLFVSIGLDALYYFTHRNLSDKLEQLCCSDDAVARAAAVLSILAGGSDGYRDDAHLAAQIRASMDKYTLAVLLAKLKDEQEPDYFAVLLQIKDNVATQLMTERNGLGLRGFGYVALGLNKAYPDTLVQPITYFATSLLYTANRAYKKWCEAGQRARLLS